MSRCSSSTRTRSPEFCASPSRSRRCRSSWPASRSGSEHYNPAPMTIDEQLAFLGKGAVNLIEKNDLRAKLQRGKPLTIKVGFDPTAPDIHLGHTVVMRKMKHFQQL